MKRILYDTDPRVVARWSCERVLKLRNLDYSSMKGWNSYYLCEIMLVLLSNFFCRWITWNFYSLANIMHGGGVGQPVVS